MFTKVLLGSLLKGCMGNFSLRQQLGLVQYLKKSLVYDVLGRNFSLLPFFRGLPKGFISSPALDFHAMVPTSAHRQSSSKCHG